MRIFIYILFCIFVNNKTSASCGSAEASNIHFNITKMNTSTNLQEIWKPIPNYEGIYEVSNYGRVKSLERTIIKSNGVKMTCSEMILSCHIDSVGYYATGLNSKLYRVHQLVAMAFLGHKPNGHEKVIDHIDDNKLNNYVGNLRLVSNRENIRKSYRNNSKGSSKYCGVIRSRNYWKVCIFLNGKTRCINGFKDENEAGKESAYIYNLFQEKGEEMALKYILSNKKRQTYDRT